MVILSRPKHTTIHSKTQFNELLSTLDELKDTNIIITCPNSDEGNEEIFELIKEYEKLSFRTFV